MRFRLLVPATIVLFALLSTTAWSWTPTHKLQSRRGQLYLRVHDDHSLLFAYRPGAGSLAEIEPSPLWEPEFLRSTRRGTPKEFALGETVQIDSERSLYAIMDPVRRHLTLELRHKEGRGTKSIRLDFGGGGKEVSRTLRIRAPHIDHLYGLGEHLPQSLFGESDGDLKGLVRHSGPSPQSQAEDPKGVYGNMMVSLGGGMVGNALFPSLALLDDTGSDAIVFLANAADSRWDFTASPWTVELRHGELQGAIAWGAEMKQLRPIFMNWTGRTPVPPRKAFGLWVSEYGYENWAELEEKAKGLKDGGFPVDGFVLDLQWFGGIAEGSKDSKMGRLAFDTVNFPNPAQKIKELASRGLGLILIEEAYVCQDLPEFQDLAQKKFLVHNKEGEPHIVDETPWWGVGSMIDYTLAKAGDYWHKTKREPLIKLGIVGHWTDLGEPEVFRRKVRKRRRPSYETPLYSGERSQLEMNNLFAFHWAESIFRGYGKGSAKGPRPFILSRTGTTGIWRFGACLWSGDIGASWESLRSHYRAQSHLAMSGLDYFGSDVGGFYRKAFSAQPGGYGQLYSRWFAAACLTDVPLRPHTMNLGNKFQTSPHLVGDKASNLANLKQRYRLIPYLYSAAHQAWAKGLPVVSPVALFEQNNGKLDLSGTHKMIGSDLLARLVLVPNAEEVEVLFPSGAWYDFESGRKISDGKQTSAQVPARVGGLLRTPLFAREGSLIPVGSAETSQSDPGELNLKVFPGSKPGQGILVEDDGWSQAYRGGQLAQTQLSQTAWKGRYGEVVIGRRTGALAPSLPGRRDITLWVASQAPRLSAFVGKIEVPVRSEGRFQRVELNGVSADRDVVVSFR